MCGGTIDDPSIKGNIVLPIENVTAFVCQWDFTSVNGTIVISANFKILESNISCSYDNILMASNGKFQLSKNIVTFHITLNIINYLDDDSTILKTYCPSSNQNDNYLILSPFASTKLVVRSVKCIQNIRFK